MSDKGTSDNKLNTPTTSEAASPPAAETTSPAASADNRKTPKRTPSKRRSFIERAQEESEELVRTMGGSLELEGGRRTRSSTRGTPTRAAAVVQITPPPSKKARTSPLAPPITPKTPRSRARKPHEEVEIAAEETPVGEAAEENAKTEMEQKSVEPEKTTDTKALNSDNDANESVTTSKSEKAATDVANLSEDKTDAVGVLPVVPEEQQNNVDHEKVVDEAETPAKVEEPASASAEDTPMETDAPANLDKPDEEVNTEKIAKTSPSSAAVERKTENEDKIEAPKATETLAPVAAAVVVRVKEPTPEPMEVDSSSNTNHSVGSAKIVEAELSAHKNAVESAPTAAANNKGNSNTEAETKKETTSALPTAGNANSTKVELPKEINSAVLEKNTPTAAADIASNNIENDIKSAPIMEELAAAGEPLATSAAIIKSDSNKTDNNETCEPKLANNAADAAEGNNTSTPQACN